MPHVELVSPFVEACSRPTKSFLKEYATRKLFIRKTQEQVLPEMAGMLKLLGAVVHWWLHK